MVYTPLTNVTFLCGEDKLKVRTQTLYMKVYFSVLAEMWQSYTYYPHNRQHRFCPTCGTSIVIVPNDRIQDAGKVGINLRAVEEVELRKLRFGYVDGLARDPGDEMRAWEKVKVGLE